MESQKSNSALMGSIIIIIILILGGIYFWKTSMKDAPAPVTTDNAADMEANLNSIELENLDQGL